MALYNGGRLPGLRLRYKDFSVWQQKLFEQGLMKGQEEYWLTRFEGEAPLLDLPIDYPRPDSRTYAGKILKFQIDRELTGKIKEIVSKTETTLYMVLLAAYNVLLYIYTRQEDIVVGSPVTGRRHADVQDMLGIFVNMLSMRNNPRGNKTFGEFLGEVKENAINAFENQDYQFDELVVRLGLQGSTNRSPLVETVFTLQNPLNAAAGEPRPGDNESMIKPYEFDYCTAKFDLTLDAVEADDRISLWITYSTELFKAASVEKMKEHFIEVLEQVVKRLDIRLKEISLAHRMVAAASGVLKKDSGDFEF
jgi:non-ribosomal peptide synthetase component F